MRTIFPHVRAAAGIMTATMLTFWSVLALRDAAGLSLDVVVLAVSVALLAGRVLPGLAPPARLAAPIVVPVAAVAATETGVLFRTHPDAGDALLVAALAGAVWLRRFGPLGSGAGTLLSLPFVAALVAPLPQPSGGRHLLWSALAAAIATGWVGLSWLAAAPPPRSPSASRAGHGRGRSAAPPIRPASPSRAVEDGRRRPDAGRRGRGPASTRMAVQLAAALTGALIVGRTFFPDHWVWPVITAYVVCSGNRGRADVAYKGVLRLAGAAAGTVLATALLVGVFGAGSPGAIAGIFVILAVASTLRPLNYAYWAGCVTAALALLYGYFGQTGGHLLETRLGGIAAGGALAIAASWLLLPVRGRDVLRARLADVLAALTEVLTALRGDPAGLPPYGRRFEESLAELNRIAPPLLAGERLTGRRQVPGSATGTVAALNGCAAPVAELTRQALADPAALRTRAVAVAAGALAARVTDLRRTVGRRARVAPSAPPAPGSAAGPLSAHRRSG